MSAQAAGAMKGLSLDATAHTKSVSLYGGALSAQIPAELIDASDLRQIPDYQECFVHPVLKDRSLVIELLDIEEGDDQGRHDANAEGGNALETSLRQHFASLDESDESNDSEAAKTVEIKIISLEEAIVPLKAAKEVKQAAVLQGSHLLQKFNEGTRHRVSVVMVLLQLETVGTELLITLYDADETAGEVDAEEDEEGETTSGKAGMGHVENLLARTRRESVMAIVQSIRIKEWTLFPEYAPEGYSKWA
jgi:hypothetical protein